MACFSIEARESGHPQLRNGRRLEGEERRATTATTMKQQSITTLPPSPEAERRSRMIKYTIAMSIRVLCIVAMLFAQGWWLVVCAAGAIFLPYFAVVIANVGTPSRQSEVLRPGSIVRIDRPSAPTGGPAPDAGAEPPRSAPTESTPSDDERGAA